MGKATTDILSNKTLTTPRIADAGSLNDANGNEYAIFHQTAAAINQVEFTNAATGNAPAITAGSTPAGGDANVGLSLVTKGSGTVQANGVDVVTLSGTQTLTNKSIAASQVNSGTLGTARLGSGTADGTTYLRGDQTWAVPAAMPTSTIAYFNLTSCPSGWAELTGARGRYVVGLPSGGTLAGTAGTALTNLEDRPTGQHNHGTSDPGHAHGKSDPGHSHALSIMSAGTTQGGVGWINNTHNTDKPAQATRSNTTGITISSATTGISVSNTGTTAGTNAPYTELLICQKS